MKRASFIVLAAIIVVANALALVHALHNRVGTPEAQLTLTQRELGYYNGSASVDDSGVTLHLQWTDPSSLPWPGAIENSNPWLSQQVLQRLGFDCSVSPASPDAGRHYQRQRPRQVFIALEYDGAGWRAWLDAWQRTVAEQRAKAQSNAFIDNGSHRSHMVPVDADRDPGKLRGRYPDRSGVVIVPAVVAVTLQPFPYPGMKLDPKRPVRVVGRIQQLPSSIHVPRPFSEGFRRRQLSYRVQLRYGALLEPWVTGVEF